MQPLLQYIALDQPYAVFPSIDWGVFRIIALRKSEIIIIIFLKIPIYSLIGWLFEYTSQSRARSAGFLLGQKVIMDFSGQCPFRASCNGDSSRSVNPRDLDRRVSVVLIFHLTLWPYPHACSPSITSCISYTLSFPRYLPLPILPG